MVKVSQKFVRLIVRRPQAYQFKAKDEKAPIPGIVFLNADGKLVGAIPLEAAKQFLDKMNALAN